MVLDLLKADHSGSLPSLGSTEQPKPMRSLACVALVVFNGSRLSKAPVTLRGELAPITGPFDTICNPFPVFQVTDKSDDLSICAETG